MFNAGLRTRLEVFIACLLFCASSLSAHAFPQTTVDSDFTSLTRDERAVCTGLLLPCSPLNFPSYSILRNLILESLRRAHERVLILTPIITDGEIVSALYSAKIRGVLVRVLISEKESRSFFSRHSYLIENGIEVGLISRRDFSREETTLLVVDQGAWLASASLDSRMKGGAILAPVSQPINLTLQRFEQAPAAPRKSVSAISAGAKNPTNNPSPVFFSGIIQENLKASRKRASKGGLPHVTRGKLIDAGIATPEAINPGDTQGSVRTHAPDVSTRESSLPE